MSRLALFFVTLSACGWASTLTNFVIVSSLNPQVQQGTLDNGDTYSGTFSFDTSLIPASGPFSIPIPAFDFVQTDPSGSVEGTPALGDQAFLTGMPVQIAGQTFSYDVIDVDTGLVDLSFVEPLGVFNGGIILNAYVLGDVDTKGTALLADPMVSAPEPATMLPALAGLFLVCGCSRLGRRTRKFEGQRA